MLNLLITIWLALKCNPIPNSNSPQLNPLWYGTKLTVHSLHSFKNNKYINYAVHYAVMTNIPFLNGNIDSSSKSCILMVTISNQYFMTELENPIKWATLIECWNWSDIWIRCGYCLWRNNLAPPFPGSLGQCDDPGKTWQ